MESQSPHLSQGCRLVRSSADPCTCTPIGSGSPFVGGHIDVHCRAPPPVTTAAAFPSQASHPSRCWAAERQPWPVLIRAMTTDPREVTNTAMSLGRNTGTAESGTSRDPRELAVLLVEDLELVLSS